MPGHRKRRQFKQTDAFTRGMVIGLKRAGWSIRQIAADTHLDASTVHRLWRRWLEQGNVAIYRNVGATRVTSARVDRRIFRQAVAAPQATCTAILQHVQDTLDHSIPTRTISRRLVANGLHSCRPLRRLPLTPPNRRQRLEWCRGRSTWMTEWHRVVFSDESPFCLSSDSRRVRVWRRRGERSNPAAIVERPTVRQRGIMVWGAIAYDSRSPLLRIQGTMTAQRYVDDVLRPVTLPYLQGVPNALYQQDNARPHTARISQQALQDVQMLPWPPYSPDLSPIEHVWDIFGRRLHALPQPRSEDELWQIIEREWRAIPQDAIRTLIDSLPRRVAACIAVRGICVISTFLDFKGIGVVSSWASSPALTFRGICVISTFLDFKGIGVISSWGAFPGSGLKSIFEIHRWGILHLSTAGLGVHAQGCFQFFILQSASLLSFCGGLAGILVTVPPVSPPIGRPPLLRPLEHRWPPLWDLHLDTKHFGKTLCIYDKSIQRADLSQPPSESSSSQPRLRHRKLRCQIGYPRMFTSRVCRVAGSTCQFHHNNTYEGLMRQEKLKEFKLGMKKQQFMFTKVSQESEAEVHASYVLSEMIAKHSKPFTEGDFIKECLIKAAETVCPGSVKTFQAISLSRNTVVERVTDMARNLNDQIKEKSSCFEAFSIACDESTDIGRSSVSCFFFRACDTDFNIFEELLELVPMHGTTTGEDIFNCVYDLLQKYNLPQSKLTSVATDGAPSMTGKTNGFVALLRKKLSEISDCANIHHTHCIIHQEVLCTKVIKMENVLTPIKKFINFIRSRGLNQRLFSLLLTELESEYSGLSYYTEVRWLSCSKVLKQFWDLKEEICQFLITNNQDITLFSDQVWLQDFSFMVDITKHLSDFNLKLQGKDQIITNMCDQVNAFKCKLVLWEKQLKNEDLMDFPTCNMYKSSLGETASYQKYAGKILGLRNEFETRFSDFKSLEGKFTLFSSIFSINIESVANHTQMEVIDIQCDSDLKAKFIEVGVSEFYKYLPARFENTRKLAYEIKSMFGSTYRCEQLFSLMKGNKTPVRSRITDVHLWSVLKLITANKISPEVGKMVAEKRCQISGRKY
ncbi:hypothetical protein LAZ67_12002754 [Cordylochernes scorpioides]|uniref:Transposase n=1 Tax=Cordylochernes scorpioides TaxID=51811 RepID=A0ABY6L209_9ARAC|nr:hypothetical protein LAZ67_12002754 [Cordylochernes scorpioides]